MEDLEMLRVVGEIEDEEIVKFVEVYSEPWKRRL